MVLGRFYPMSMRNAIHLGSNVPGLTALHACLRMVSQVRSAPSRVGMDMRTRSMEKSYVPPPPLLLLLLLLAHSYL
jgi:hypothetical protein